MSVTVTSLEQFCGPETVRLGLTDKNYPAADIQPDRPLGARWAAVFLTGEQAAALVNDLMPYAARALALRWWDGEWWSESQYDAAADSAFHYGERWEPWDDLPLGPPAEPTPAPTS